MEWKQVREGNALVNVPEAKIVSKEMPVFYNPVMALNRSLAIMLLKARGRRGLQIADPLAGSGIRALRFLKELPAGTIKNLFVNDANPRFPALFRKALKQNNILPSRVIVGNTDASVFLLQHAGFDYIDIDPFGSPNPFLDAACKRIARNGILALTATDTAALTGTYPAACKRKYDSAPLRNELMHEIGIRILVRKAQLIGAQYEKALRPILCYATAHYYRVYFLCEKSKKDVDAVLSQHGMFETAGPLWQGRLWDATLVRKMLRQADSEEQKLLSLIAQEAAIPTIGFFDIHKECKRLHISAPKTENVMRRIRTQGYPVAQTHFSPTGVRTTIPRKEFVRLLRKKLIF